MAQTLFIDDEVIANLNEPFNNFNSKQIIQILERIVETNYSKLEFQEIELIRTLEKFNPNIVDEISAKLAAEEELEELNSYNSGFYLDDEPPFVGWTEEQELELMAIDSAVNERYGGFGNIESYDDDADDDEHSIFLNPNTPFYEINTFVVDIENENVLNSCTNNFTVFPEITEMLIVKFGAQDYVDKNKALHQNDYFTALNADCVQAFLIDITNLLEIYDTFDDVEFINNYAKLFNIDDADYPYFSEEDINAIGESLTSLSDSLYEYQNLLKTNQNKNLLFAFTVDL